MTRLYLLSLLFIGCFGKPRWHVEKGSAPDARLSVRIEEVYRVDGHALLRIAVTQLGAPAPIALVSRLPEGTTVHDLPEVIEPGVDGHWAQTVEVDWRRGCLPQTDLLLVATLRGERTGILVRGAYRFGRASQSFAGLESE